MILPPMGMAYVVSAFFASSIHFSGWIMALAPPAGACCCEKRNVQPQKLDPWPRVFLIQGLGFITAGATEKDVKISGDIYRHTVAVVHNAEQIGTYDALPEEDIFDVEYWVLEQAKLKLGSKKMPLTSKVAVVTGGASGIGLAITKELTEQGAKVFSLDLAKSPLSNVQSIESDVSNSEKIFGMDWGLLLCVGSFLLLLGVYWTAAAWGLLEARL